MRSLQLESVCGVIKSMVFYVHTHVLMISMDVRFVEIDIPGSRALHVTVSPSPLRSPEISTFVITSFSSQNLCKAHFS